MVQLSKLSSISVSCSVPKFLFLFYAHNDILLLQLPVCSSVTCVSMFGGKFIPSKIVRNLSICSSITVAGGRDNENIEDRETLFPRELIGFQEPVFLVFSFFSPCLDQIQDGSVGMGSLLVMGEEVWCPNLHL